MQQGVVGVGRSKRRKAGIQGRKVPERRQASVRYRYRNGSNVKNV